MCSSVKSSLVGDKGCLHLEVPALGRFLDLPPHSCFVYTAALDHESSLPDPLGSVPWRVRHTECAEQRKSLKGSVGTVPELAWQGELGEGRCDLAQTWSGVGIPPPPHLHCALESPPPALEADRLALNSGCFASSELGTSVPQFPPLCNVKNNGCQRLDRFKCGNPRGG